ncbi:MAG: DUF1993 family protein [Gammaproteobacteria bacterium]|nr:DUF1993 family protein [Gammaproteobacteria bacterium]
MLHTITVIQFSKMLGNLSAILDKAETFAESKKIDMTVLLNSRLSANQFSLISQIQISCDTAKNAVARLTANVESMPKFEDNETTIAELQTRISSVQEYLAGFKEEDFGNAGAERISQPRWKEKYMDCATLRL